MILSFPLGFSLCPLWLMPRPEKQKRPPILLDQRASFEPLLCSASGVAAYCRPPTGFCFSSALVRGAASSALASYDIAVLAAIEFS